MLESMYSNVHKYDTRFFFPFQWRNLRSLDKIVVLISWNIFYIDKKIFYIDSGHNFEEILFV